MVFRKTCALLCCAALALPVAGCSGSTETETSAEAETTEDYDGIIAEASKDPAAYLTDGELSGDDSIGTINGEDIPAGLFLYGAAEAAESSGVTDTEGLDIDAGGGYTYAEQFFLTAQNSAAWYIITHQKADEYGVTLSEEEEKELANYLDGLDDDTLLYYGTTAEDQEYIYETSLLYQNLKEALFVEGGEYEATDEALEEYISGGDYVTVDYLYFGVASTGDVELSQEAADEALAQIDMSDIEGSMETLSESADAYMQDYTFDASYGGESEALSDAASALQEGELVTSATDYGVYLIYRKSLDMDYIEDEYTDTTFTSLYYTWQDEADIVYNENYDKLDTGTFFERLFSLQNAISQTLSAE